MVWARGFLSDDASLVVTLLRQVADSFKDASIYRPLLALSELNPDRRGKLVAYARDQFSRGRGILWTSQLHGLDRLLRGSSFALCTPTGSGKTLVANLALIKELLLLGHEGAAPLAMYLVPSRALAGEVEAKLRAELGDEIIVTGLYGGADWGNHGLLVERRGTSHPDRHGRKSGCIDALPRPAADRKTAPPDH